MNTCIGLSVIAFIAALSVVRAQVRNDQNTELINSEYRVVNLNPELPPLHLTVLAGGERVISHSLTYLAATSREPAGLDSDTIEFRYPDTDWIRKTYTLRANTHTIYLLAAMPVGAYVSISAYQRPWGVRPPQGIGYINFIHACPDVHDIEVEITDFKGRKAIMNGFPFSSNTAYDTLTSGDISVVVRRRGGEVLAEGRGELPSGVIASVILSGKLSNSSLILSLLNESSTDSQKPLYRLSPSSSVLWSHGTSRTEVSVFPNTVAASTSIKLSLDTAGVYTLELYDLSGSSRAVLLNRRMEAGVHTIPFLRSDELNSGVYFLCLKSKNGSTFHQCKVLVP